MKKPELRPKARAGLCSADHSKRGQRLVSVLDPARAKVTLLEPWEHAILVLADGTRSLNDLAGLLGSGIAGEIITERTLERCLKYFEQEELIEPLGLRQRSMSVGPAGPRTLAHLQQAYREWHKDPVKTGQILTGLLPIDPPNTPEPQAVPAGLSPTVALPPDPQPLAIGSTLTVGASNGQGPALVSVLGPERQNGRAGEPATEIGALAGDDHEERLPVADLLRAVDDDFERLAPKPVAKGPKTLPPVKAIGGFAEIPAAHDGKGNGKKLIVEDPVLSGIVKAREARTGASSVAANPEVALNPTMVGRPPEEGSGPPIPVVPARSASARTSPGERVGAMIGPEPRSRPSQPPVKVADVDPLLEETQQLELNTESVAARRLVSGLAIEVPRAADGEPTTSQTSAHLSKKAADVFELLRKAGLSARSDAELDLAPRSGGPRRRLHPARAEAFQKALESLTAGDLDVALGHFRHLEAELPGSARVKAFIEAIRSVRGETEVTSEIALDHFEGLLEDALAYGRCPRCLSMMAPDSRRCAACTFELDRAR
ncbi:MAG: hypothetical protein IPG45_04645 [Deltaproteobacteria bacterium]|nr:hypothetical protein [Deltaproteobacteria bacterium]